MKKQTMLIAAGLGALFLLTRKKTGGLLGQYYAEGGDTMYAGEQSQGWGCPAGYVADVRGCTPAYQFSTCPTGYTPCQQGCCLSSNVSSGDQAACVAAGGQWLPSPSTGREPYWCDSPQAAAEYAAKESACAAVGGYNVYAGSIGMLPYAFQCSKQYPQYPQYPSYYPQYPWTTDPFAQVSPCQQIADMVNNYANSMYRRNLNVSEKKQCKSAGGKLVYAAVNLNKPYSTATTQRTYKGVRCKCPTTSLQAQAYTTSPFIQSMIA